MDSNLSILKVRHRLKELGKSQAWLAQEARLSLVMVNCFLNGRKKLSPFASERVANALKLEDVPEDILSRLNILERAVNAISARLAEVQQLPIVVRELSESNPAEWGYSNRS